MDVRTISSAAYSRPPVFTVSADSATAATNTVKTGGNAAPYLSPVFQFDPVAKLTILSYRDPGNGQVTTQIPSERVVEQYRRNGGKSAAPVQAEAAKPEPPAESPAATSPVAINGSAPPAPGPAGGSGGPDSSRAAAKPVESKPVADSAEAKPEAKPEGKRVSLSV